MTYILGLVKKAGTIHLYILPRAEQVDAPENNHFKKLCYMGRAFEKIVYGETISASNPVNENLEDVNVYENTINDFKVLYAGEMDGQKLINGKLKEVEIKTSYELRDSYSRTCLINKCQKWWAQTFLVGIEDFIIGYRDRAGQVNKVAEININEVVKIAELGKKINGKLHTEGYWKWQTGIVGLQRFLKLIHGIRWRENELYAIKIDSRNGKFDYMRTRRVISEFNF